MNEIAFFMENQNISYTALIITLAAATAVVCAVFTAAALKKSVSAVLVCAGFSMVLAPICARAVYWYCVPEKFGSAAAMFAGLNLGGYCLPGAIIGVLLAALLTRMLRMTGSILELFDSIAPAAALGIAIGRLGGFFTNDDKGNYVFTDSSKQGLPLSFAVTDEVTGVVEWRFASFIWEAIAGMAIFIVLITLVIVRVIKDNQSSPGGIFMTFLCLFGATQAALESTRYDALHMRSNGFISMMQMFALVMILIPPLFYTVNALRDGRTGSKTRLSLAIYWAVILVCLAGAGVAEYFIQRKGSYALQIYPAQMIMLLISGGMTWLIATQSGHEREEKLRKQEQRANTVRR